MKKRTEEKDNIENICKLAEKKFRSRKANINKYNSKDLKSILHELEVHQIELEMQNEELRYTQIQLEESNSKYFNLYNFAPVGYLTIDKKGLITEANLTIANMLGIARSDLFNKIISNYIYKEDQDIYYLNRNKLLASNEKQQFDIRMKSSEGTPFWVNMLSARHENTEGKDIFTLTVIDISQKKQAEEKISKSEEKLKKAQLYSKIGSWSWDIKTNTLEWSDEMYNIFGIEKDSFSGSLSEVIENSIHPDDRKKVHESNKLVITKSKPVPLEYRIIKKDGTILTLWAEAGELLYDESGKPSILSGFVQDISDRKLAEKEIIDSQKMLKLLYLRLEEVRENERSAISREIHDEFGQALTALKIDLNWIKEKGNINAEVKNKIKVMVNIVTDTIKNVQRISSELSLGMLNDLGLISAIEWYCQEFVKRTGLKLILQLKEVPDNSPKIKLTLYRIVQEALTNINRHSLAKNVNIKLYSSKNFINLIIADNGIGFNRKKLGSKDSLGLIGMNERIKQFNGSLEIDSSKGKGTKLNVKIPI